MYKNKLSDFDKVKSELSQYQTISFYQLGINDIDSIVKHQFDDSNKCSIKVHSDNIEFEFYHIIDNKYSHRYSTSLCLTQVNHKKVKQHIINLFAPDYHPDKNK